MGFLDTTAEKTALYIRKGGSGNRWTLLDEDGSEFDAPTGGGADVESRFGMDSKGKRVYLGAIVQGDRARITTVARFRPNTARFIAQLRLGNCPFDLAWLNRCGDISALTYTAGLWLYDGNTTNRGWSDMLAQLKENTNTDPMRELDLSFAPIEDAALKLKHLDITGTVSDFNINKVLNVGVQRCSGDCSIVGENDGEQDFWAVTDSDSTPGHGGAAAPNFLYTQDGGNTWTASKIQVLLGTNAHANSVAKAGDYAVVVGQTGIAYAKFQDILDGVSNPWTLALSAANINDVVAVSPDTLYACANSGIIYKSTDGGFSWSTLSNAAQTAQNLVSAAFVDTTTGYFVGNSGAIVQYFNGTLSLLTARTSVGGAAITTNFTKVACAPYRGTEFYLGTSTGVMYRCTNALSNVPLVTLMGGLPLSGNGTITDLQFAGYRGSVLFIVQTSSAPTSRVLRDISGGATNMQIEEVGTFTSPSNFGINSIAPASITLAITVGEVHETYGFIGKVQPQG